MSSIFLIIFATFLVSFLIYTAGGIEAPGVFWLSVYPFVGGILLGKRGTLLGGFFMAITLLSFLFLDYWHLIPHIVSIAHDFKNEKIIEILSFSFTSLLTTYYFIRNEELAQIKVENQKKEIELLLKLLLHDVATPLTSIQGALRVIKKNGEISTSVERHMNIVERSSQSIISLLSQIKSISAIKDGKGDIESQPTNVNEVILSAIELVNSRAVNKNISFVVELDPNSPIILIDPNFFKISVLSNILTNAIKFSSEYEKILIKTKLQKNKVLIEIKDNGIGIPKEILENIFNLSVKTTRVGTNGESGTGYGMPIMKSFVERFGGSVEVTSVEKTSENNLSGTTFLLTFKKHLFKDENASQEEHNFLGPS